MASNSVYSEVLGEVRMDLMKVINVNHCSIGSNELQVVVVVVTVALGVGEETQRARLTHPLLP
jgi:hypothetical protein